MKIELTRTDLCNLIMSCTAADSMSSEDTKKWQRLRLKLKGILQQYDSSPSNKIIYKAEEVE